MNYDLFQKFKLWQFSFAISLALLSLGFTGGVPWTDIVLRDGQGTQAAIAGVCFFIGSVVLRYLPPPQRRSSDRPKVAVSSTQIALVSQFDEWTNFEVAAQVETQDHRIPKQALQIKNTELRLELATLQGILQRRVSDIGVHEVRNRFADDKTTYVGGQ